MSPSDTDAEAAERLVQLFRASSEARRLELAVAFSADVMAMARDAYRRADPTLDEHEAALRFVARHYGDDLARAVRFRLQRASA